MRYVPEYAKGQVLVKFGNAVSEKFAKEFGEVMGYHLSKEEYPPGGYFIYITPEGKENRAISHFREEKRFVKHVCRRDIKQESRWETLEHAIEMISLLNDTVTISDSSYFKRIREISAYLKKSK
jgi:hypothetical protein